MERLSKLSQKEIIDVESGAALGRAEDVEFDLQTGKISAVVLPGKMRAMGFLGREPERVIPWEMIKRIGDDVILVDIREK